MPDKPVDLRPFKRANTAALVQARGRVTLQFELHALAQLGYGLDPNSVPVEGLRVMGRTCPAIYPAEQTISGIVRRPDLFSVRHPDPKIRAEVEAWLWPLLTRLLAGAARGFIYGTSACLLDWERRTLRIEVPKQDESGDTRAKTLVDHTHFGKAFELHPDVTAFHLDAQGEIVSLEVLGETYDANRVVPWIWDPEFGEVIGQGARQRAWLPYCTYLIVRLLRDKYLERSVDSPRIVYAPEGKVTIDGVEKTNAEHAVDLVMDVQGSGTVGLPSVTDNNGKEKYRVQTLDLPDRKDVWAEALDRCSGEVFQAYLVPPPMAGALEDAGGAATKALDGMLREFIENLALYCAAGLTRIVQIVHAKNYDPEKVEPPEIIATDVGKANARKTYLEVIKLANAAARGEVAARADLPKLLDALGIPVREAPFDPFSGPDPSARPEGRPRDEHGDREGRREDARTPEGEEDTGAPRDGASAKRRRRKVR
jgi:hypothetical protein